MSPDALGNRLDDCGVCTLVPTESGRWVSDKQATCPVHGTPPYAPLSTPSASSQALPADTQDGLTVASHQPIGVDGDVVCRQCGWDWPCDVRRAYLAGWVAAAAEIRTEIEDERDVINRSAETPAPDWYDAMTRDAGIAARIEGETP